MPSRLVGRLGLEEEAPAPPTSPDPNMQMIWTVSAEEKEDLEASTEKLKKVLSKAVEQKKKITSEKTGSPKVEQKAKEKDTTSEKTGTPKAELKAKKTDTVSEKTGTPKTEKKAKKENTASEKVGTPKTEVSKKVAALPKIPKKAPLKKVKHEIRLDRREYTAVTATGDQTKEERDKAENAYIKARVKGYAGNPKVISIQAAKDKQHFKVCIELTDPYVLSFMIPMWNNNDAKFEIKECVTPAESSKIQKE